MLIHSTVNLIPLTLAPALLTACIYTSLTRIIVVAGAQTSRLKPKLYTYIFISCDLLALVLQAIGGGMAATARNAKGSRRGVDIMIAGLISQVITMTLFLLLWADFVLRTRRSGAQGPALFESLRQTKTFSRFQWSLFTATLFIFIRCIYRVAELWDGFGGKLANHEATFMIFEGPMIILAVAAMTVWHPRRVFGEFWGIAGKDERGSRDGEVEDDGAELKLGDSTAYQRV